MAAGPMPYHNMTIASVRQPPILWFGWVLDSIPAARLGYMDIAGIARVAANTTLAACSGGLAALLFVYPRSKKWGLWRNG